MNHARQDLRSLRLHQAAVEMLVAEPALARRALETLERWRATVDPRTFALLDEWRRILEERDWPAALAETERGNQLRQASPLGTILPQEQRLRIIQATSRPTKPTKPA